MRQVNHRFPGGHFSPQYNFSLYIKDLKARTFSAFNINGHLVRGGIREQVNLLRVSEFPYTGSACIAQVRKCVFTKHKTVRFKIARYAVDLHLQRFPEVLPVVTGILAVKQAYT